MDKKPMGYWNYERCEEESKKYTSRTEFKKGNVGAYKAATRNGWMDIFFPQIKTIKSKGYWNYDTCYEEAKKYTSRSEFERGNQTACQVARKNKWLDDYYWFEELKKPSGYWTYERCYEEAKKYHFRSEFERGNQTAYQVAKKNKWLDDYYWFERKSNPIKDNMYNVYVYFFENFHTAYIGLTNNIKRRDNQHNTKTNSQVYIFAEEHNIPIPQITILEENISMNDSLVKEDFYVKKYKEEGWNVLNKAKTGLGSGSLGSCSRKWTRKRCYEEAKKYKSRIYFSKCCASAYQVARKNKWLDDYYWFEELKKPSGYWTYDTCYEEAKKYTSRSEFQKGCVGAYNVALKNKWLDDYYWMIFIIKPNGYWNDKNNCKEETRKYKTRNEFRKGSESAYQAALKHGWMDEFFPKQNKAA